MKTDKSVKFFLNLAKIQSMMTRRFDNGLGGISLSEFMILLQLSQSPDSKLRRTDLAEKVGLTASGITRLLIPMEKIGLVKREADENDGRTTYAVLASGGKRKLAEGMERAELLAKDIISDAQINKLDQLSEIFVHLGGDIK